jgi:hypothetical protein
LNDPERIDAKDKSRPAAKPPSKPRKIAFVALGLTGTGKRGCSVTLTALS